MKVERVGSRTADRIKGLPEGHMTENNFFTLFQMLLSLIPVI
jgi:hypothetical protein